MRSTRFSSQGVELEGEFTGNNHQPLVVLVHGLCGDRSGWARGMSTGLAQHDLATLRFDLAGHGTSNGTINHRTPEQNLADVKAALEHAQSEGYSIAGVLGNSYGGFLSLHAVNGEVPKLGLQSPVWNYNPILEQLSKQGLVNMDEWRAQGTLQRKIGEHSLELPYAFCEQTKRLDGLGKLKEIQHPVLVTHGTADTLAPYAMSAQAAHRPNTTLVTMSGADHGCQAHFTDLVGVFGSFFSGYAPERNTILTNKNNT